MNYEFRADLAMAKATEQRLADYLVRKFDMELLDIGSGSDYDLLMQTKSGRQFSIEVKEDFMCEKTGNVAVEYWSRGKASGISVTVADYYFYVIHEPLRLTVNSIKTDALKNIIITKQYFTEVSGGDAGSDTKSYLFKLNVIKKHFKEIYPHG